MKTIAYLKDAQGAAVPFHGIEVTATIADALTTTRVVQRYRNDEARPIEAVYTFPLPVGAVLLDFDVVFGERRMKGEIVELGEAERRYEAALDQGDTAVLVEDLGGGLHAANLGNLLPGETAEIVFAYAAENRWEDGRLRWRLPMVIAPRYGRSGLGAQHEPATDPAVDHRARCELRFEGKIAAAAISSPSHPIEILRVDGATIARPSRDAIAMDRDLIVDAVLGQVTSAARMAPDGDGVVVWASFIPKAATWSDGGGRTFTILLDCSGSMAGDSIAVARQALGHALARLTPQDHFNLILFGSTFVPLFAEPVAASEENLRRAERVLRNVAADMGGTEMAAALGAAYERTGTAADKGSIILITDGQVAGYEPLLAAARASGCRVFPIGVGNQVQEALARRLGEVTGGAAELVAPGEALAEAIARQFRRIKAGSIGEVTLDWPQAPHQATPLPAAIFAGDAFHLAAWFPTWPTGIVTLRAVTADGRAIEESLDLATASREIGETSARMAAGRRLAALVEHWRETEDIRDRKRRLREKGVALALRYRLLCPWTGMVLIRENAVKASGQPVFRKVAQMAPAGMTMVAPSASLLTRTSFGAAGPLSFLRLKDRQRGMGAGCMGVGPLGTGLGTRNAAASFRARLEAGIGRDGPPAGFAELIALGLAGALQSALTALALRWGEAAVVRAFVDAVLGRPPAPGTPDELAAAVRRLL